MNSCSEHCTQKRREVRKLLFLLREMLEIRACLLTQCLILSRFMKTFIITIFFVLPRLAFSSAGFDETRLQVDPKLNLSMEDLYKKHLTGKNLPKITSNSGNYTVDYSLVVDADAAKLQIVAQSYPNYVKWNVPNLDQAEIIPNAGDYGKTLKYDKFGVLSSYQDKDTFILWNKLSVSVLAITFSSKQYFNVLLRKNVTTAGDFGSSWYQVPDRGWGYPDESEFEDQKGSWYLQKVPAWAGATAGEKTYIRYFLQAKVSNPLVGTVDGPMKTQFKTGALELVKVLVDQSHKR